MMQQLLEVNNNNLDCVLLARRLSKGGVGDPVGSELSGVQALNASMIHAGTKLERAAVQS